MSKRTLSLISIVLFLCVAGLVSFFLFQKKAPPTNPQSIAERIDKLSTTNRYEKNGRSITVKSSVPYLSANIVNAPVLYAMLDKMGAWSIDGFLVDNVASSNGIDPGAMIKVTKTPNFNKTTLKNLHLIVTDYDSFKEVEKYKNLQIPKTLISFTDISSTAEGDVVLTFYLRKRDLLSERESDISMHISSMFFNTLWEHTRPAGSPQGQEMIEEEKKFANVYFFPFIKIRRE